MTVPATNAGRVKEIMMLTPKLLGHLSLFISIALILSPLLSTCLAAQGEFSAKVFVHDEGGVGVSNMTVIALSKEMPGALETKKDTDSGGYADFSVSSGRYVFSAEGVANGKRLKTDLILAKIEGDIEVDILAVDRSKAKAIWLSATPKEMRANSEGKVTVTISTRAALPVDLTFYGIEESKSTSTTEATFEISITPMMENTPIRVVASKSGWQRGYWDIPVIAALPPTPEAPQINSTIEEWLIVKTYIGPLIIVGVFVYPVYAYLNYKSRPRETMEEFG